jgi:F1F0 ATPase subunit 2
MNDLLVYCLVIFAGLFLGFFFFGGLWWSTKKAISSKHPFLWFTGSLFIRMSVTILTIYFVSRNHWEKMLLCLLGFIIARVIVIKLTKNFLPSNSMVKEVNYENECR